MSFLDRIRESLGGSHDDNVEERLRGYRRLGEQVYEVEVELAKGSNPRAMALLQAAKCLQKMADALLTEDGAESKNAIPIPEASLRRAEEWYSRIPDLLVAARREAAYPNTGEVGLPVRIKDKMENAPDAWSEEHLLGLRRAVHEVEDLLEKRIEHAQLRQEEYKNVILYYQEARTRQEAGDSIVGLLVQHQDVAEASRREAESQYMSTLSRYLLIAQGLEEPVVLTYEQIEVDFNDGVRESRPVSNDSFVGNDSFSGNNSSSSNDNFSGNDSFSGGVQTMNFEQMQQQSNNIQQHNTTIVNQLQQIVTKVQQLDGNDQNKQDIAFALRELALSVRGLNQETMGLMQNMALYIQHLEDSHQHAEHYQQQYPQQYQQPQPTGGLFGGRRGGGFWNTLIQSAEIGAGFEIGSDIVNDIFGGF